MAGGTKKGRFREKLKTGVGLTLFIICSISGLATVVLLIIGYLKIYGNSIWVILLVGFFAPITSWVFPFLWYREFHVIPWVYIMCFAIAIGTGAGVGVIMMRNNE